MHETREFMELVNYLHEANSRARKVRKIKTKVSFRKITSLDGNVRNQLAMEVGEDEITKDGRFQLLQKYGLVTARIDRRVSKPAWMEEHLWKILKQQFHNATKGLIPERKTFNSHPNARPQHPRTSKPWREIKFKDPQAQARHNQKYQKAR